MAQNDRGEEVGNTMDVQITATLAIPAAELNWQFSRSSGPGGQHVNTTDSRVELSWVIGASRVLSDWQRQRLLSMLGSKLVAGALVVTAAEERSQWRNRQIAQEKLAHLIQRALASDAPVRKATKPTRGSQRRRLSSKANRSATKALRRKPGME